MNKYLVNVYKNGEYIGTTIAKSLESVSSKWHKAYPGADIHFEWKVTKEGYRITYLKELTVGDYFVKVNRHDKCEKTVFVRDSYDRPSNKYGYYKFYDVNDYKLARGITLVTDEMTF